MVTPRIDCASIRIDGGARLMFAGGVDNHPMRGQCLRTATVYDALSNSWADLPSMACERHGCSGAEINGTVYVVGGGYASKDRIGSEFFEAFDLATQEWRQLPLPDPALDRVFAAVGVVGGKLILAGGEGSTQDTRGSNVRVDAFVPANKRSSSAGIEAAEPKAEAEAEAEAQTEANAQEGVGVNAAISQREGHWEQCAPLRSKRSACGFCEWRGMLVVAGGRGGAGEPLESVEIFDGERRPHYLRPTDIARACVAP